MQFFIRVLRIALLFSAATVIIAAPFDQINFKEGDIVKVKPKDFIYVSLHHLSSPDILLLVVIAGPG